MQFVDQRSVGKTAVVGIFLEVWVTKMKIVIGWIVRAAGNGWLVCDRFNSDAVVVGLP
jgi:hypothetical protein